MMEAELYEECLHVMGRCEADNAEPHSFETKTRLAYYKARCLEETGDKARAVVEYERLLQATEGKAGVEFERRNCERRLKHLTQEKVPD